MGSQRTTMLSQNYGRQRGSNLKEGILPQSPSRTRKEGQRTIIGETEEIRRKMVAAMKKAEDLR